MSLPTEAQARKAIPVYSGFVVYFPDAIAAVAQLSQIANEQHNPGTDVHWDRSKSKDELDAMMRHTLDMAKGVETDTDDVLHATKQAWRSMANLQKLLESKKVKASNAAPRVKWCVPCGAPVHNEFCERDWSGIYAPTPPADHASRWLVRTVDGEEINSFIYCTEAEAKKIFHHVIRRI